MVRGLEPKYSPLTDLAMNQDKNESRGMQAKD
jgi:hypothetical protein